MQPRQLEPVPETTPAVRLVVHFQGDLAMVLRDELDSISTDEMCVDLFPKRGRPAPGAVAFGGGHRPAGRLSI